MTGEPAEHPLPNPHLRPLDIGVGKHRFAETHDLLVSVLRLEYAVDHTTVEMQVSLSAEPKRCPKDGPVLLGEK